MNTKTKIAGAILSAAVAIFATSTLAAGKGPLQIHMSAYTITNDANGQEVATETTEVDRKQTVEFRAAYQNNSASPLSGVTVVGPIPQKTEYLADTAFAPVPAMFEVSINGGKTFEKEPVKRMVQDANGNTVETIVPPSRYTHVRWMPTKGIPGNSEQIYSYRVKVK